MSVEMKTGLALEFYRKTSFGINSCPLLYPSGCFARQRRPSQNHIFSTYCEGMGRKKSIGSKILSPNLNVGQVISKFLCAAGHSTSFQANSWLESWNGPEKALSNFQLPYILWQFSMSAVEISSYTLIRYFMCLAFTLNAQRFFAL
jgi:hypothetical protein